MKFSTVLSRKLLHILCALAIVVTISLIVTNRKRDEGIQSSSATKIPTPTSNKDTSDLVGPAPKEIPSPSEAKLSNVPQNTPPRYVDRDLASDRVISNLPPEVQRVQLIRQAEERRRAAMREIEKLEKRQ